MNVVVLINGREAIPVRAIPFVTGRWMSPDVVARSFALTDHWRDMKEVSAYQLLGDVIHGPVLPKEWDVVEDLLQALENRLKSLSDDRTETRPTWITESTLLLPAAVFVWKDQFEQYFRAEYSPQRFHWIDERPGDRELNFSPMIMPPELRSAVMEGFESQVENTPPTDTPPQVPDEAQEQTAPSGTSEKAAPDADGEQIEPMNETQAKLLKIVDALESYAEGAKLPFDRQAMPGPLGRDWKDEGSFHWLCGRMDPTFKRAPTTFKKHRAGICALMQYAEKTNFYRLALPHIAPIYNAETKARKSQNK